MAVASRARTSSETSLADYIVYSLEFLWLLTAALIPLIFVPTDYVLSEAVNAYVEVPKTVALRTLVGIMTMLWMAEWVVKGGLTRSYTFDHIAGRLANWITQQPSRWIVVAAVIYMYTTIVATLLSVSFSRSVWGEVAGQYGYSAYTNLSYFLLFMIIATHLRTRDQLWRLLAVLVGAGAIVGFYGIFQHFGLDPYALGEGGSTRISATMANPVFTGAFLVGSTLLTMGLAFMALDNWQRSHRVMALPGGLKTGLAEGQGCSWSAVPLRRLRMVLANWRGYPWLALLMGGLTAAQLVAVGWTGSRGSWLFGVPPGVLALPVLAAFAFGARSLSWPTKTFLYLAVIPLSTVVVLLLLAVFRTYATDTLEMSKWAAVPTGLLVVLVYLAAGFHNPRAFLKVSSVLALGGIAALAFAVGPNPTEWYDTITSQATERGLSFRTEMWEASLLLTINRPWFEFEPLSMSYLRPLVGYGPELFKYTFPLESPLGGLLSHAHNFFLHHWVEQGILGLFSSLGLFVAFFSVGLAQLLRNLDTYSTAHKWLLIILMATMVGRTGEMMVGVARESDLVMFWIMLAAMVVLPSVMGATGTVQGTAAPQPAVEPPPAALRRDRRGGRRARRERRQQSASGTWGNFGTPQYLALVTVIALVLFVGWLTWDRSIEYGLAARDAAVARDLFEPPSNLNDWQSSERIMSRAVSRAPDVPNYYNNVAGIYDSYRSVIVSNRDQQLQSCDQFFSLDDTFRVDPRPEQLPVDASCIEAAYTINLNAFKKNTTSPQTKLTLANSTIQLALLGYEGKASEAIRYFEELTDMLPFSQALYQALGTTYLRLNLPEQSLAPLDTALQLSQGSVGSAEPHYYKGVALGQLEQLADAAESLELSLAASATGPRVVDAHRSLADLYARLEDPTQAAKHNQLLQQLLDQQNDETLGP